LHIVEIPESVARARTSNPVANPFAAPDVGAVYAHGRPYHHPRTLARIRTHVGDAPLDRALDVACGTGMSTVALREFAASVVGADISREMMRAAAQPEGVSYLLSRSEDLPVPAGVFDAVTCCSGVHWFDQPRFYAELARVLRSGGWVALYDHYFMRVRSTPLFREWVRELFDRYPLPPRGAAVGDPALAHTAGFEVIADEAFDDDIVMTQHEFADYQLTLSHCVAAVDRGIPPAEVHAWLMDSTAPMFADGPRTIRFLGSITVLRLGA
jgi:ubiquinone/menaquinone biosynthesis C-methylase UbiE